MKLKLIAKTIDIVKSEIYSDVSSETINKVYNGNDYSLAREEMLRAELALVKDEDYWFNRYFRDACYDVSQSLKSLNKSELPSYIIDEMGCRFLITTESDHNQGPLKDIIACTLVAKICFLWYKMKNSLEIAQVYKEDVSIYTKKLKGISTSGVLGSTSQNMYGQVGKLTYNIGLPDGFIYGTTQEPKESNPNPAKSTEFLSPANIKGSEFIGVDVKQDPISGIKEVVIKAPFMHKHDNKEFLDELSQEGLDDISDRLFKLDGVPDVNMPGLFTNPKLEELDPDSGFYTVCDWDGIIRNVIKRELYDKDIIKEGSEVWVETNGIIEDYYGKCSFLTLCINRNSINDTEPPFIQLKTEWSSAIVIENNICLVKHTIPTRHEILNYLNNHWGGGDYIDYDIAPLICSYHVSFDYDLSMPWMFAGYKIHKEKPVINIGALYKLRNSTIRKIEENIGALTANINGVSNRTFQINNAVNRLDEKANRIGELAASALQNGNTARSEALKAQQTADAVKKITDTKFPIVESNIATLSTLELSKIVFISRDGKGLKNGTSWADSYGFNSPSDISVLNSLATNKILLFSEGNYKIGADFNFGKRIIGSFTESGLQQSDKGTCFLYDDWSDRDIIIENVENVWIKGEYYEYMWSDRSIPDSCVNNIRVGGKNVTISNFYLNNDCKIIAPSGTSFKVITGNYGGIGTSDSTYIYSLIRSEGAHFYKCRNLYEYTDLVHFINIGCISYDPNSIFDKCEATVICAVKEHYAIGSNKFFKCSADVIFLLIPCMNINQPSAEITSVFYDCIGSCFVCSPVNISTHGELYNKGLRYRYNFEAVNCINTSSEKLTLFDIGYIKSHGVDNKPSENDILISKLIINNCKSTVLISTNSFFAGEFIEFEELQLCNNICDFVIFHRKGHFIINKLVANNIIVFKDFISKLNTQNDKYLEMHLKNIFINDLYVKNRLFTGNCPVTYKLDNIFKYSNSHINLISDKEVTECENCNIINFNNTIILT